jgi:protein phosphatase
MIPTRPLNFSAVTHPGLARDNNEDCYLSLPEYGIWLVADGMGGHEAGEVASAIVRDTVKETREKHASTSLSDSIQASHRAVLEAAARGVGALGMGSTVVALYSHHNEYEVAWVGDSRAYLWTNTADGGRLEQLTTDHSYVQMLLDSGAITAEELENHPEKNIITQCIGSQELADVRVDMVHGQWQRNQWILLCSDGLSDELDDKAIAQVLCDAKDTETAADQLLHAALTNGGHDNITLQIIESPFTRRHPLAPVWQWIPYLTGRRRWDALIYGAAVVSLLVLLYSIVK